MKTKVITLEQFAELINAADEWKLEFSRIIEENGWIDLTGDDTNICVAGNQKLYFDESGYAVIKEIKHEITDAEYDSRTEYLSYRADGKEKWAQGEFYQKPNGKHTHSHIFDDGVEVEFEF